MLNKSTCEKVKTGKNFFNELIAFFFSESRNEVNDKYIKNSSRKTEYINILLKSSYMFQILQSTIKWAICL